MKRLIYKFTSIILIAVIVLTALPCSLAFADGDDDTINITVSGTENYDYAFEVLEKVNNLRANLGLNQLEMSEELLDIAMKRASEISLYFSHTRPDGTGGWSENIAAGSKSPEDVMNLWINSEGHYNNIINVDAVETGIGCFKDNLGNCWWVQLFSCGEIYNKINKSGVYEVTQNISIKKEYLNIDEWKIESYRVDTRQSCCEYKFDTVPYMGLLNVKATSRILINSKNFTFTSDNEDVVSINTNGEYTIGNAGTATLSAVLKEDPTISFEKNIIVQPQDISWATLKFSLDNYTFIYDGTPKTPKVLNTLGLIEGKDYIVNYENNINAAVGENRGKVTITGIGNYTGNLVERFFIRNCENHEFKTTKKIDPDCINSGTEEHTCKTCGFVETTTIPATGHKYSSDWIIDVSPTCTAEGSKSHHCVVCGANKDTTLIPKSEHNYSAKITKTATCTTSGVKTYTCSVCKDSYTETIPAKGHNYGSWTTTNAATCTTDGIKTGQCSACGKTETQTIAKTGHNFITTVIKAATCTDSGINKTTCSDCGESRTENALAKGHSYSTKIVKPSYEAQGCTIHTCYECGDCYKDNYTDQLVTPNISKVNFTTSSNTVTMSWTKVAGATGYRVYKYNTSTKKWQGVANTKNTSYTFTKLNSSTDYSFTVRAYTEENGKNYLSPKYTTFKTTTNPANIAKVNFKSSANSVKMSWSKVSGATGYRVYQYNTSTKKWKAVANVKNTNYTFKNLKAGTTYKFTVRAYKTLDGKTYLSPKYSTFTTSTNPVTVSFKLTAGSKKATVKWTKVTGATGYKVYYKTSKNGSWKSIKTVNNKTTSYTKTGLTKGKTYYFTVKAYRTVGGKIYNGRYTAKSVKVK